MIRLQIPMRLPSRANLRQHWAQRAKLVRAQHAPVLALLTQHRRPALPCSVRLTRISPRALDRGDNDPMSLKGPKDAVAQWLGVNDADERVRWFYGRPEVDGRPHYQAARIEIAEGHRDCECCGQEVFDMQAGTSR